MKKRTGIKQSIANIKRFAKQLEKDMRAGKVDGWALVKVMGDKYETQMGYVPEAEVKVLEALALA